MTKIITFTILLILRSSGVTTVIDEASSSAIKST